MRSDKKPIPRVLVALLLLICVGAAAFYLIPRPRRIATTLPCTAVAFSPDGSTLATGHEALFSEGSSRFGYGLLRLWQMPAADSGETIPFLEKITSVADAPRSVGGVGWLRFSPDGKLVLAGNHNYDSLGVLEVASRRWLFSRKGEWGKIRRIYYPLGFTRDGSQVLYLTLESRREKPGDRDPVLQKMELVHSQARTGAPISRVPLRLEDRSEWPLHAAVLPPGDLIACSFGLLDWSGDKRPGRLRLISARTGKRVRGAATDQIPVDLACAPDGQFLATLDEAGAAHLWNLRLEETGRAVGSRTGPLRAWIIGGLLIHSLTFSGDGRWLAGISRDWVAVWDTRDYRSPRFFRTPRNWVRGVALSPDGKQLAVAGGDEAVLLWSLR